MCEGVCVTAWVRVFLFVCLFCAVCVRACVCSRCSRSCLCRRPFCACVRVLRVRGECACMCARVC